MSFRGITIRGILASGCKRDYDGAANTRTHMPDREPQTNLRSDLGVIETVESDNIVRWDGDRLYVEQDVFHNGQLVHRKYRRNITEPVARVLSALLVSRTH